MTIRDLFSLFRITMKPYYYIYRVGYGKPTIKHQSLALAHTEAMRLAGQHPGETFEILECLGIVQTTTPQAFWMDGVIPPSAGPLTNATAQTPPDSGTKNHG